MDSQSRVIFVYVNESTWRVKIQSNENWHKTGNNGTDIDDTDSVSGIWTV